MDMSYSKLYITEYNVVFWPNDTLVSTTTQRDGSYKKEVVHIIYFYKPDSYLQETKYTTYYGKY